MTGPRPLVWMRQLAQERWREKAGRVLDRVPRPAIWEPGQWGRVGKGYGKIGKAIWGFQPQGEDHGVFTGIVPLLCSDW